VTTFTQVSPELRRSRVAILAHFFILGAATATWAARLPAIKATLHMSDYHLGLALFAVPAGSVVTLVASGKITDRFGAVRVLRVAGLCLPVSLVAVGIGPALNSLPGWIAALVCYGALAGLLDVSMNACGARLELAYRRPILSSLHAGYSIAGLAGAGIGGIFALLAIGPLLTFVAAAVLLAVLALVAGRLVVLAPAADGTHGARRTALLTGKQIAIIIWILGLLGLCGQLGEGAAGDWSAVYIRGLGSSAAVAAVGLAAFSVTMAAGRMVGDRLAARFGSVALVRASGLIAGLGLAGGLLIHSSVAAIAGFALLGAGQAGIFPQLVSSAARLDPEHAGRNIGRIAAVSYMGLLCGPVVIGAVAAGVGLRNALLIPAALSLLVAAVAGVLSPHGRGGPGGRFPPVEDRRDSVSPEEQEDSREGMRNRG